MNANNLKIKAVTFDLWETLLFERDGYNSCRNRIRCDNLAKVLNDLGVSVSTERLISATDAMSPWLNNMWEKGEEVTHIDQIRFIVEAASNGSVALKKICLRKLVPAYVSAIFELPPYLNPDAPRLLQRLKDNHKKIGLICNTGLTPGFTLREFLRKEDIGEYFDVMVFSDEVSVRKPNPEIFRFTARELKIATDEAVHIGDNLKSDVWGAKNAGLKAIHFSTEIGRDRIAESDPASLVSMSRNMGELGQEQIAPDKTITSLSMVIKAIEELEK